MPSGITKQRLKSVRAAGYSKKYYRCKLHDTQSLMRWNFFNQTFKIERIKMLFIVKKRQNKKTKSLE